MKKYLFASLFSFFLFLSCSKDTTAPIQIPDIEIFNNFFSIQVDYDSIEVKDNNSIFVDSKYVDKIIVYADGEEISHEDYYTPTYEPEGDGFLLDFTIGKKVDPKHLNYEYKVKYYLTDGSTIEYSNTEYMLQYPQGNVRVFKTGADVLDSYLIFQDFAMNAEKLFFLPSGFTMIYEYSFNWEITRRLVSYGSGNHIAQDSSYLFFEWSAWSILRYNLEADSTDLQFDLSNLQYTWIKGLECYQGKLHVLFHLKEGDNYFIGIFDYSGQFIKTIPYPHPGKAYGLTIYSDIIYSNDSENFTISRYDLKSETFLTSKMMPTMGWEGIRVYDGLFYFVDWDKRVIAYVPLNKMKDSE